MSLNHIIKNSVPDTEALDVKFNNVTVLGDIIQTTDSLSYYGGLDPTNGLSFTVSGVTGATLIPPSVCTMCQQTGTSFQVGYFVTVDMPTGVTANEITILCPYPDKLRTSLIANDPSVINVNRINTLGYSASFDKTAHNSAYLIASGLPAFESPQAYIRCDFVTDNGLPFTSSKTYVFKIQHTQG